MSFNLQQASKKALKLRIAITGPSGSGKTYGSLLLARGIASWEKTAIVCTENGSANYYADLGPYNVIEFQPPYSPERFAEAIRAAEAAGMEVVVLDSISHEWAGKGGILDIKDTLTGNDFAKWSKLTPRHEAFLEAIKHSKCHVIATIRAKQDYEVSDVGGRTKVEKLGLAPMQRDGIEYEFGISFAIDMKHNATASKDRTGVFDGRPEFRLTPETGTELLAWADRADAIAIERAALAAEVKKLQDEIVDMMTGKQVSWPDDLLKIFRAKYVAAGTSAGALSTLRDEVAAMWDKLMHQAENKEAA